MIISKILSKIDISNLRFRRSPEKEKEKPSLIKEVIDEPEKFKLEAFIEGNEITPLRFHHLPRGVVGCY